MTIDQINSIIAKEQGWIPVEEYTGRKKGGILLPFNWVNTKTEERKMQLPNYVGDLNEMFEVEKNLTDDECGQYNSILFEIVRQANPDKSVIWCADRVTSAPPACRVGAYLKLKGLYEPKIHNNNTPVCKLDSACGTSA